MGDGDHEGEEVAVGRTVVVVGEVGCSEHVAVEVFGGEDVD